MQTLSVIWQSCVQAWLWYKSHADFVCNMAKLCTGPACDIKDMKAKPAICKVVYRPGCGIKAMKAKPAIWQSCAQAQPVHNIITSPPGLLR